MMKRFFCVLLSLALLAAAPFALAEDTAPAEEQAPVLLATVNGKEILSDDAFLMSEYQYYLQLAEQYGMDTSSEETLSLIRPYSIQGAINSYLILEKAAELGLDKITDEETAQFKESIQASWEEAVQYFIDMMGNVTETSTEDEKAAARADALAYIKENYGYEEESYIQASMDADIFNTVVQRLQAQIVGDNKVADDDIVEYFNALVQEDKETYQDDIGSFEFYSQYYGQPSYYTPEGYRGIIHILLKVDEELMNTWKDLSARLEEQQSAAEAEPTETEEPAADAEPAETPEPVTEEMVAAAEQAILDSVKETVDEINAKLEGGASFTDLIKEYGTDTGMQSESNLANGYMVHKDSILWDPAFKKAALELDKIGDVSKPVVGQYGVHILQYLKDIPGGPVELTDEMKEDFRATLQGELEDDLFQTAIEEWLAAATVEYTEAGEAWKLVPEEPAAETGEAPAEEAPAE